MIEYSRTDTILYFVQNRIRVIPVIKQFTDKYSFKSYSATDFADVFATPFKAAIFEKELIEDWFFDHLRDTYLDHTHDEALKEIDPDFNCEFDEILIILGKDPMIPGDLAQFFTILPEVTIKSLERIIFQNNVSETFQTNEIPN